MFQTFTVEVLHISFLKFISKEFTDIINGIYFFHFQLFLFNMVFYISLAFTDRTRLILLMTALYIYLAFLSR